MEKIKEIIQNGKPVLIGSEILHLTSILDIFKHSVDIYSIYFNKPITIRFSFKHWKGWIWNDVMLIDDSKMTQLEDFPGRLLDFRLDLLGIHNEFLPENTSTTTYFVSINRNNLNFDSLLSSFCSKELQSKLNYLILSEESSSSSGKINKRGGKI